MNDYTEKLKADLLEQFKNKRNIEALMEVIGRQLNDVSAFFRQLKDETDIQNSIGKQLDGIGDIVVLTRAEAGKMIMGDSIDYSLDDESYRKYLIFKILKNTCNCTYYDIMKAIGLFWSGPPLKYSENADEPATICFDFETEKDLADMATGIPFVKSGGVGLHVKMHKTESFTVNYGVGVQRLVATSHECEVPSFD